MRKAESLPAKIWNKTRVPTLATFIQHIVASPSHSNQTKEIKGIQIGREEVKLLFYADDMILHIENPRDSMQKLLQPINEFSKVAGNKINIHKSVAFLYTNNEILEKEYKNKITFKVTLTKIKHLGINLAKEVKDLYAKKNQSRKLKRMQRNGKIFHVLDWKN